MNSMGISSGDEISLRQVLSGSSPALIAILTAAMKLKVDLSASRIFES